MSSKPSPQGVAKLRELAIQERSIATEFESLGFSIRTQQARYAELSDKLHDTRRAIVSQLDAMDCASNGNMGWKGRIVWMLGELLTPTDLPAADPKTVAREDRSGNAK